MPGAASDREFMQQALALAHRSGILPYPNPWVGALVVKGGRVLGRGWHLGPGTDHAEVMALTQAGTGARGATLYVTLEPCCHWGRTPPCTEAILRAGVREVVFALRDPNPEVAGRGLRILRSRGLRVTNGVLADRAAAANEAYLKYRATGLPFVTAKVAATLDGKIATRKGESKWITDEAARQRAHHLRRENQAVLVGVNTVLADNPNLGPRCGPEFEPWRVVLDSKLRTPLRSQVVGSGRCIVACSANAVRANYLRLERAGARVWRFHGRRVPLRPLLKRLAEEGILAVLVEGGSETHGSFFDQELVDRVFWFVAPAIIGSSRSLSAVGGRGVERLADARRLRDAQVEPAGNSWLIHGNLSRWALKFCHHAVATAAAARR